MVDEMNPVNFRLDSSNFNIDNGYLEGIVRGFKSGILTQADYSNLTQCDTLEGGYAMVAVIFRPYGRKSSVTIRG